MSGVALRKRAGEPCRVAGASLATWLVEATLRASGASGAPLSSLAGSPALFPFVMPSVSAAEVAHHPRLEVCHTASDAVVAFQTGGAFG